MKEQGWQLQYRGFGEERSGFEFCPLPSLVTQVEMRPRPLSLTFLSRKGLNKEDPFHRDAFRVTWLTVLQCLIAYLAQNDN